MSYYDAKTCSSYKVPAVRHQGDHPDFAEVQAQALFAVGNNVFSSVGPSNKNCEFWTNTLTRLKIQLKTNRRVKVKLNRLKLQLFNPGLLEPPLHLLTCILKHSRIFGVLSCPFSYKGFPRGHQRLPTLPSTDNRFDSTVLAVTTRPNPK